MAQHKHSDLTRGPSPRRAWPRLEGLEDRLLLNTYTVTNVNDSGPGSLRQAILDANGSSGLNTIAFQIGSGLAVIQPRSPLPRITNPVVIDGTTQPGYRGTPLVVLDGTLAGTSNANGLVISAGGSTVQGLAIEYFHNVGILLQGVGGDLITSNYLGTDFTGTQYAGNGTGVEVTSQAAEADVIAANLISGNLTGVFLLVTDNNRVVGNRIGTNAAGTQALENGVGIQSSGDGYRPNVIGGTTPADRNLISGNFFEGVKLDRDGDEVLGNYIGTDITGTIAIGNGAGIYDEGGQYNTIGGTAAGAGNVISGNGDGIYLYSGDDLVQGNLIGLNAAGTAALPNATGIDFVGGGTVGGTAPGAGNVISGNLGDGVVVDTFAAGALQGNFIGTSPAGTAALPNGGNGVTSHTAYLFTVGGTAAGAGNLIAGNGGDGLALLGSHDLVQGNTIGTNAAHTAALPNRNGISITGMQNTIGGSTSAARNIIAGNTGDGVLVSAGSNANLLQGNVSAANGGNGVTLAAGARGTMLLGNAIGTTPSGYRAFPNGRNGVAVFGSFNTLGGTAAGAGNVIAANLGAGVLLTGSAATDNLVQGNYIGTTADGLSAQGNGGDGLTLAAGASFNTIGGTMPGAGNEIGGNQGNGIGLTDSSTASNLIEGNALGTDPSGTLALGNGSSGVAVVNASGNTIGGTAAGAGNTIAFNGTDGVLVDTGTGNAIQQNSILNSGNLGIELVNGGNLNQSAPVLTAVTSDGSSTTIAATLTSAPDTTFTVEFYTNDVCNPSGSGEGQTFLGTTTVTTDDSGAATFTVTLDGGVVGGQYVSATATDPAGNTSAFAACWQLPSTTLPGLAALQTTVLATPLSPTSSAAPESPAERRADALFGLLGPEAGQPSSNDGGPFADLFVQTAAPPTSTGDPEGAFGDLLGIPAWSDRRW